MIDLKKVYGFLTIEEKAQVKENSFTWYIVGQYEVSVHWYVCVWFL